MVSESARLQPTARELANRVITVLTPSYNRAYILPKLYESLCAQTKQGFEWLIVDDGSIDDTKTYAQQITAQNRLPIRYVYQQNGGKPSAINAGVKSSENEWIFIVDSDDILASDAIETIERSIELYDNDQISGLCFRRMYSSGKLIGENIAEDILRINPTTAGRLFNGDLAYIFKREAMNANLFPYIENEKFIPELYIWNKISDIGQILFFARKAIYITEYLPDGYTKNFKKNLRQNPKSFRIYYRDQFWREKKPINKIKMLIRYLQCNGYILRDRLNFFARKPCAYKPHT
ncbi:MAG: glycosyltransferase family 2 protein [Helicobacteraceae bacterium]|jgi:glycosyltransferase involved in cell wall biosynthesis|nr:glycosyltransferase family 2 protein [Helicobacteraceae bacterium]